MAAVNFSIKVVDQNGSSLSGMRIELYATPLLDPWHDSLYTDDDGWAYGEYDDCISCSSVSLNVVIDGEEMGEHYFPDGSTKSFTI